MQNQKFSGKTVEEATQRALQELGTDPEAVEITVLRKGKTGLFGLGSEEALIRVEPRQEPSLTNEAKKVLEELLHFMRLPAQVHPSQVPQGLGLNPRAIALDIRGRDLGILIGRQGQTLASLQYLVNLMVSRRLKSRLPVIVDVEGYKSRHYEALRSLALRLAEQVRNTGQPVTLEPMPAFERRVVHLALSSFPDIVTQSVGNGTARKVVLSLRQDNGEGDGKTARARWR